MCPFLLHIDVSHLFLSQWLTFCFLLRRKEVNKVTVDPPRSSPRLAKLSAGVVSTSSNPAVVVVGELNNASKVVTATYKRYNHHLSSSFIPLDICMLEIGSFRRDKFSS